MKKQQESVARGEHLIQVFALTLYDGARRVRPRDYWVSQRPLSPGPGPGGGESESTIWVRLENSETVTWSLVLARLPGLRFLIFF